MSIVTKAQTKKINYPDTIDIVRGLRSVSSIGFDGKWSKQYNAETSMLFMSVYDSLRRPSFRVSFCGPACCPSQAIW